MKSQMPQLLPCQSAGTDSNIKAVQYRDSNHPSQFRAPGEQDQAALKLKVMQGYSLTNGDVNLPFHFEVRSEAL